MPVGVLFMVRHAETRLGESVRVVGGAPEMAAWNVFDNSGELSNLQMVTNQMLYPQWQMLAPVWVRLPEEDAVQQKSHRLQPGSSENSLVSEACDSQRRREHRRSSDRSARASREEAFSSDSSAAQGEYGGRLQLEYKYVKDRRRLNDDGVSFVWEDQIANRFVQLPREPGSIWLVADQAFNVNREPPRIVRTTLAEVISLHQQMQPERTHFLQAVARSPSPAARSLSPMVRSPSPEWSGTERAAESGAGTSSPTAVTSRCTDDTVALALNPERVHGPLRPAQRAATRTAAGSRPRSPSRRTSPSDRRSVSDRRSASDPDAVSVTTQVI
eukprot:TRINITY_DN38614_c0_g4_i1.p1 TRINITY_DN38614_c0_g4~~TRINITY_DN38614_c0_g4_i1.p1  ORF type:complete len:329 (-),score=46.79 TRINITY_DN38614_c0_g4_i1:107-1093(-)